MKKMRMKKNLWHVLLFMGVTAGASEISLEIHHSTTGGVELAFEPGGASYAVEYSTNLIHPRWQVLTGATVTTDGSTQIVSDLRPAGMQKFYRVRFRSKQQFHQPDGAAIPTAIACVAGQPFGLQVVFTNQCLNGSCEASLWHVFNDNSCIPSQQAGLDAYGDAFLQEAYTPSGPIAIRLASRGRTPFQNAFGWYNVTGGPPGLADIHTAIDCSASEGSAVVLDIASDPSYLGGAIGFALITPESHFSHGACAAGNCCASIPRVSAGDGYCFYTNPSFDPDHTGASSYIHCLTYQSIIADNRFYLAWDDRNGGGDNDFVDMVIVLDGVTPAP